MLSVEKRDYWHYIWLKRASQEQKYRNQPKNWFRIGCYIVSSVGKVLVNEKWISLPLISNGKIVIAVAAGVVAIFAVTSIADLRGSNKKIVSLAKKREQIEQEMRDKQA